MTITPDMPPGDSNPERKKIVPHGDSLATPPLTEMESKELQQLDDSTWSGRADNRDFLDPGIKIILKDVEAAEDALTQFSENNDVSSASAVLSDLDRRYHELGVLGRVVSVSGKIRAVRDDEGDMLLRYTGGDEKMITYLLEKLGEPKQDIAGEYFEVSGLAVVAAPFDLDEVEFRNADGPKEASCAVVEFGFVPIGYPDEAGKLLYMYKEDIEYLGLTSRTTEGDSEVLEQFYPEIVEVVEQLPDSCLDTKAVVRAIRRFELTIDWRKMREFDSRGDCIAAIERYIMQRLNVDTADYRFVIWGNIGTVVADLSVHSVRKKLPRVYRMRMTDTKLLPVTDENGDIVTYRLGVEAYMPVPEDGGGAVPVLISPDALLAMRRTRPRSLPFNFDTIINHKIVEDDWTQYVRPINGDMFMDPDATKADEMVLDLELQRAERAQEMIEKTRAIMVESPHDWVQEFEVQMQEFLDMAHEVTREVFSTTKERSMAREQLKEMYCALQDKYQERPFAMEVRGEGLLICDPTPSVSFDDDAGQMIVVIKGTNVAMGDITTSRKGVLQDATFFESGAEPGEYRLMPILRFVDLQRTKTVTTILGHIGELPYYELSQQLFFHVQLHYSAEIRAEYSDALKEQEDVMHPIIRAAEAGDTTPEVQLPLGLYNEVQEASATSFIQSQYMSELKQLAIACQDDIELCEKVCERVTAAIGRGASLMMAGVVYGQDGGVETHPKTVTGKLIDIVPMMKRADVSGPTAVLQRDTVDEKNRVSTQIWYIPLMTMTDLKF